MTKYSDIKHEDLIMKKAMDVFAEEGLKFFGIDKKVKDSSSTEIVVLEAKNLHMDYTFLMEDDTYIHVEFQTTDKGKDDLRRFRAYESLLSFQTGKDVVTYVVYSNGIQNVKTVLETGINEYRYDVESMLYAFADKFLDGKDLEKVKEEISMTKLGEMLVEDGIKKGKIEGKEEQAIETAKIAIKKGLSDELICELTGLSEKEINAIRIALNE